MAVVMYVTSSVACHLWSTIFLRNMPWVDNLSSEVISVLTVIAIGYTFAMRPFVPHTCRVRCGDQQNMNMAAISDFVAELGLEPANERPLMQNDEDMEWRPGMPYPSLDADSSWMSSGDSMPILLVENPKSNESSTMVAQLVLPDSRIFVMARLLLSYVMFLRSLPTFAHTQ